MNGYPHAPTTLPRGRRHRCPWNAKLGWLQGRSGHSWRRVRGPCQDLHSVASSSHPIHDTDSAIPTPLVEILAKYVIFCLNLDLMYFLCVCQFSKISPTCREHEIQYTNEEELHVSLRVIIPVNFLMRHLQLKCTDNDGKISLQKLKLTSSPRVAFISHLC